MIYYLILISILILKIRFKKDGVFLFWVGFYLFLVSIILDLLKINNWSEFIIRVGFIFLLLGFIFVVRDRS